MASRTFQLVPRTFRGSRDLRARTFRDLRARNFPGLTGQHVPGLTGQHVPGLTGQHVPGLTGREEGVTGFSDSTWPPRSALRMAGPSGADPELIQRGVWRGARGSQRAPTPVPARKMGRAGTGSPPQPLRGHRPLTIAPGIHARHHPGNSCPPSPRGFTPAIAPRRTSGPHRANPFGGALTAIAETDRRRRRSPRADRSAAPFCRPDRPEANVLDARRAAREAQTHGPHTRAV